jgi:hypothetical protein
MEVLGQQLQVRPENANALLTKILLDLSPAAGVRRNEFSIRLIQQARHRAVTFRRERLLR